MVIWFSFFCGDLIFELCWGHVEATYIAFAKDIFNKSETQCFNRLAISRRYDQAIHEETIDTLNN